MTDPTITAPEIKAALRTTYAAPEWALFFEVSDGTGAAASRRADAIAMSLWPSRGLELRAFEIKVSRGDLQAELRNPAKAEAIAQFCDTFYLVTPTGLIREDDDIPSAWGVMTVGKTGRVVTRKKAVAGSPDLAMTRPFLASLLRAATKADDAEVKARIRQEREKFERSLSHRFNQRLERELAVRRGEADRLSELFQKLEGVTEGNAARLLHDEGFLKAVAAVRAAGVESTWQGVGGLVGALQTASRNITQTIDSLLEFAPSGVEEKETNHA